jgi:hypothetical protein
MKSRERESRTLSNNWCDSRQSDDRHRTSCNSIYALLLYLGATVVLYYSILKGIRKQKTRMPPAPRRLSPVPAFESGTSTSRHDNPYLAASLATQLQIAPPNIRNDSASTVIPSPVKSPVRLGDEDLNDTPGESDPSASRMDLSALPKGYLEVSEC